VSGALLELRAVTAGYAGVPVVHDVDLEVGRGEVVALLGSNGAGKSTTLLAVSGLVPLLGGSMHLDGEEVPPSVSAARVARRARAGLAHVPEDRGLFPDLTVAEHLRLARDRRDPGAVAEVLALFPALEPMQGRRAGLLSGGEQQMLALARALASRPSLLLVDEMSLGLAPIIVEQLLPALRAVADRLGAGVLMVEQHVALALEVADRAYLLRQGRIATRGTGAEMAARLDELEAGYFGDEPAV
jgi:branched-chain amino acid transport system ATP-binding protein